MVERADASISEISAFEAVGVAGSFTKAAESLGTSKSHVGKLVQRLEARLGTRLFQRTTRAVRLTEDGETYLLAVQSALGGLREAEQELAARRDEVVGRVRLDLPASFGRLLFPAILELRQQHPKLTFELGFSDKMSDPVADGWDLVVRIGELPKESDMTVRKLCDTRFGLYASPAYLASRGEVRTIADLAQHDAVIFRGPSGRLRPWALNDGGEIRSLSPEATVVVEDGQALNDALINGLGISQLLDRIAQPHVEAGRLQRILTDADVDGLPVHAMIPSGQKMPLRTRVVLNRLADFLKDEPRKAVTAAPAGARKPAQKPVRRIVAARETD
ncbi:LysR family transcriptional regulator [Paraburkholderia solisilvae]|uniref:HTH-type transcriptional regulator PgrR n=1 Tax=Paraburkholderia solisilvae TaxID=624376 RepID=A0A6J5DD25_9BURK|nr:LysR family transcriptional regulator [Paraburkholderia solisilvae]CAB3751062.1 HTH-type transcriptional regulator PgrR [Paraburkholderia solisilvae]